MDAPELLPQGGFPQFWCAQTKNRIILATSWKNIVKMEFWSILHNVTKIECTWIHECSHNFIMLNLTIISFYLFVDCKWCLHQNYLLLADCIWIPPVRWVHKILMYWIQISVCLGKLISKTRKYSLNEVIWTKITNMK